MCAQFSTAIPFILKHEGGYFESPAGEVVNRGINTDTLKAMGWAGTKDELKEIVKNLTIAQTETIYQKFFWEFQPPSITNSLDQLTSQIAANKILDMRVLAGQVTGIVLVQRALGLAEDGAFGPHTLASVQTAADGIVPSLVRVWSDSLTKIADRNIATAQTAKNETLVKYWTQVKPNWLARAAWNGQ